MKANVIGYLPSAASPVPEIQQALRAVSTTTRPHLLGYTAVARMNPFQSLLYREFGAGGVAVAPVLRGHDFRVIGGFRPLSASRTIHFHWMSWVLGNITHGADAGRLVGGLLGRIDKFRSDGGKVVWTVHNVYPHDARFVEEELRLQQGLADRADVVHVMAHATTDHMDGILDLDPARTVLAPHPSYVGAYESHVSRAEARAAFGIDADETVFLVFGALKKYKALGQALGAFHRLCDEDPKGRYRLLVAGLPDNDPEVADFVDRCVTDPRVLIDPRRVATDKAQLFLRASDVGLVTYARSLNSGAALLYLSFGLSVVATDTPVFREALPAEAVTYVANPATGDLDGFASGLARGAQRSQEITHDEVLALIAHLDSRQVSAAFRDELGARLGW